MVKRVVQYAAGLVGGLSLVGCGGEPASAPEPDAVAEVAPAPAAPAQQSDAPSNTVVMTAAMAAIKDKLVDPESARFRNVKAYPQQSGTTAICGEVNAKNRAGGYDGYERFISAGTAKYTWLASEMEDIDSAWATICK